MPTLNVSLMLRSMYLYLRPCHSSTMSRMSKTSRISASGGAMSRRCARLAPCLATTLVQVGREMARIKEHDRHREDGIEVRL